ncbi:helix-turn-helix transcriptional regulator [Kitasatospora atroaurantiaca]|uniref:HTH luxR-type domain-containing protein n=1 Tax=Kitasatospora atroaurantiaca TaxID=285545 RepID=A0A561ENI4_9ACTN|nr:hypothetical protein [Kitasatospora atroaurantiaca]TWE17177.1 hypothetical protein FB465_2184 [Kitasatospora atroaurantiaca]
MVGPTVPPPHAVISDEARELYARMATTGTQPSDGDEEAVRLLRNLGLIRDDPAQGFVLVDPQYVGARWEASLFSGAAAMLEQASAVSEALRPLRYSFDHRAAETAGLIEYYRGSEAINWRLEQILGGCGSELLVCQPGGPRRPEIIREAVGRDLAALRRGVTMHTLYHEHARTGAAMDDFVDVMTAAGAEIRTLDEHFERMIIIDRRIAVIPGDGILTDSAETVAYVVNDPGVAGFVARKFEQDWKRATPWGDVGNCPARLDGRKVAILRGLAAGESQQQIARRLEIRPRAMAEAIAELKALFDAQTLFELACRWKDAGGA